MEYRRLGASGFKVPVLSFGTGTFGGKGEFFSAWGNTDVAEARRLVDVCLDAGVTMFDTADVYSSGASESILGEAIKGRRDQVLISTKATFRFDDEPNNVGSSRYHLIQAIDAALKRLGTDYIDLFQLHGFDAMTPVEETLSVLDDLVRAGKIRYLGVSNFSGWHLMKSLGVADRYGYTRYVANQTYYSLVGRDYEWELMPLALDQGIGAVVWSPLGWGRLTGKIRYLGVSNFSGWHLMKSLAVADRYGYSRYVANQAYYSLIGRDFEWELMPLALDQGIGTVVWSPLGWGRLTGKIRRGQPLPATSRLHKTADAGPQIEDEYLYRVVDALDEVAKETGKSVPQIALNWLLQRPTVSTVVIGARNEEQLRQNLDAVGWNLSPEQMAKLDQASAVTPAYPYWHQRGFAERNPPPV